MSYVDEHELLEAFIRQQLQDEGRALPKVGLALGLAAVAGKYGNQNVDRYALDKSTIIQKYQPDYSSQLFKKPVEKKIMTKQQLQAIVKRAADKHGIDPAFLEAIAYVESRYQPDVVYGDKKSSMGAQGMMQFMPGTAKAMGLEDPTDPVQSAHAGAKYLKRLLKKLNGDQQLAAAAYNAGIANVMKYGDVPPFKETQNYVKAVKDRMDISPFKVQSND